VKHRYQIDRYCKLHNMQKRIIGCWKCDFDKILLTNCNQNSHIWIYNWTPSVTGWQPAQFRRVRIIPSNHIRVDSSDFLHTRTAILETVRFGPRPRHEVTVRNRCLHEMTLSLQHSETEWQRSIKDFWLRILGNLSGDWLQRFINDVLAAFRVKNYSDTLPAPSWKWASTDCQRFLVLDLGNLTGDCLQTSKNEVVAAIQAKNKSYMLPAPSWNWKSTECQRYLVLHLRLSNWRLVANLH